MNQKDAITSRTPTKALSRPGYREEFEKSHFILETLPFLIATIDADQRFVFLNREHEKARWFACPRERLIGRTVQEVLGEDDYERARPYIERVLSGEAVEFDVEATAADAVVRHTRANYTPCRDPLSGRVSGYVSVVRDITAEKEAEDRIRWLAYHDPLTRLPNRALFHDRLEQALAQSARGCEPLAILYIDLDGFKPINDTFGHDHGDDLLRQVADRLRETVRTADTVSRQGGDEFVILLPFLTTPHEATIVARRIHGALTATFTLGAKDSAVSSQPSLSACIGISLFPEDGTTSEELLRNADRAMYLAKRDGPGSFYLFNPAPNP